jgi:hypothetical protein
MERPLPATWIYAVFFAAVFFAAQYRFEAS